MKASGGMAPIDSLSPNPWNTNKITDPVISQKLRASLKELGAFKPILVRTLADGQLQILGGEHRWKEAQALGMTEVPIWNVGAISDDHAKKIGLVDNARYGEDDTLGLASLLKELGNDIMMIMPFSDVDLAALADASSLALDDLDSIDSGPQLDLKDLKAAPTSQLMRFKVPVDDVDWVSKMIEREMKAEGLTQEDSLSNAGHALISLLRKYGQSLQ